MASVVVLKRAGASTLQVEEPDIVIYRLCGLLQVSDLRALREAEWQWNVGKKHLLVLIDIRQLDNATFEARKEAVAPGRGTTNRAVAVIGGSHTMRVVVELTMRAVKLLTNRRNTLRFFQDEPSAREWLLFERAFFVSGGGTSLPLQ
jgi:hypothetical protein